MNGPIINDRLASLPRTRPPGYWAVNFTDAQLRKALDPEPTEQDELIRAELDRRAKLPVIANPRLDTMPAPALRGWADHVDMLASAAQTFDDVYPATRAYDDIVYALADLGRPPRYTADEAPRLFDAWRS